MPRIKASDIFNLKLDLSGPKESYGNAENELKEFEVNVGPKKKKSTAKKDIKKLLKEVDKSKSKTKKSTKPITDIIKLTKKVLTTKKPKKSSKSNIPEAIELTELITKQPKSKKPKIDTESINDSIKEIDKLLKAPKKALKKLVKADKEHIKYHPSEQDKKELKIDKMMSQAKDYKHKSTNVSHEARDYVDRYINIFKNSTSPQSRGRLLNQLKVKVYTNLKPSDADDANNLINEFKRSLEPPSKVKKAPVVLTEESKKEKQVKNYIKTKIKQGMFQQLKDDEENINFVVKEAINKRFNRLSVDFIQNILEE